MSITYLGHRICFNGKYKYYDEYDDAYNDLLIFFKKNRHVKYGIIEANVCETGSSPWSANHHRYKNPFYRKIHDNRAILKAIKRHYSNY